MYVLTSNRTFSAAEEFTYNLKNLNRATIVGETTGRVRSAISGGNWEGRGVIPDIDVAAADALTVAHARALKRLIEVAAGDWRVRLERVLQALEVPPTRPALESNAATTATDSELAERVDALMKRAASSGLGGAVVLERDGRVLLSTGYGLAKRRLTIPFTTDTIAPINSITKSVTALAVMQLSARGHVDLQAPVGAYLKGAGEPAASSRLHDVLVHHAGLPPHCGEDWEKRTKAQLIDECTRQPLAAARGALSYSNPGYSYLAAIVEELSGQTWEDYLRAHVFEPAGMNRSGWPFGNREALDVAEAYVNDVPGVVPADRFAALGRDVWNWKGNGELHASASDMHRFYRFLMQQPARILEPMTMPQTAEYGAGVRDGYGFALRFDRSGRIYRIGSSGSDGHSSRTSCGCRSNGCSCISLATTVRILFAQLGLSTD